MTTKQIGLAAFTNRKPAVPVAPEPAAAPAAPKQKKPRRRAEGATVAITARLDRDDWARLRQLADAESTSLQRLVVDGLTKVFAERGLPPMRTDEEAQ